MIHYQIRQRLGSGEWRAANGEWPPVYTLRYSLLPIFSALSAQSLFADRSERRGRGDGLGIDFDVDERRLAGTLRRRVGLGELGGALHCHPEPAEGARIGGEIRVLQLRADDAARIFALLMHQ